MKISLQWIPIINDLVEAKGGDHKEALKEVFWTSILGFIPLLVSALILKLKSESQEGNSYSSAVLSLTQNGELIFYTISILSALLYVVLDDFEKTADKRPRNNGTMRFLVVILILFTYAAYGLMAVQGVRNNGFLVEFSYWAILLSISLWYIISVFKHSMTSKKYDLRGQERDFSKGYARHRN